MDRLLRPLGAACLALALAGCGTPPRPAWEYSFDSPEALAGAALDALASGDELRLARLALSEDELRETVWPLLPASRDDVGMPWAYFWRAHAQRSTGYLRALIATHGGKGYELTAVAFDGSTTYGGVAIHREASLDLRTPAGPQRLRLFGSMAERGGRWKLYSFIVD